MMILETVAIDVTRPVRRAKGRIVLCGCGVAVGVSGLFYVDARGVVGIYFFLDFSVIYPYFS